MKFIEYAKIEAPHKTAWMPADDIFESSVDEDLERERIAAESARLGAKTIVHDYQSAKFIDFAKKQVDKSLRREWRWEYDNPDFEDFCAGKSKQEMWDAAGTPAMPPPTILVTFRGTKQEAWTAYLKHKDEFGSKFFEPTEPDWDCQTFGIVFAGRPRLRF